MNKQNAADGFRTVGGVFVLFLLQHLHHDDLIPVGAVLQLKGPGLDAIALKANLFIEMDGAAVILVTHDLEFAASYADRCSLLFGGEIVCTDEGKAFFLGNNFYTTALNRITRGIVPDCVILKDVLRYV